MFFSCVVLVSCGGGGSVEEPTIAPNQVAAQIPEHLSKFRDGGEGQGRLETFGDYYVDSRQAGQLQQAAAIQRQDDIVYTKPDDNRFTVSEELQEIFSKDYEGPWMESLSKAGRRAQRERKPLLIWFSSGQGNPSDNRLTKEVFDKPEFVEWAPKSVVRLKFERVNADLTGEDKTKQREHYDAMRKRFGVFSAPTVIIQMPDGKVFRRYRGFRRGDTEFYFSRIVRDVELTEDPIADWWKGMEKKGYRIWKNSEDKEIVAKLVAYKESRVSLVEPNGRRSVFDESILSLRDRQWILAERRKRGLVSN